MAESGRIRHEGFKHLMFQPVSFWFFIIKHKKECVCSLNPQRRHGTRLKWFQVVGLTELFRLKFGTLGGKKVRENYSLTLFLRLFS